MQSKLRPYIHWNPVIQKCQKRRVVENPTDIDIPNIKNDMLRPPLIIYLFLYSSGFIITWLCSGLITGIFNSSLQESLLPLVVCLPLLCAFISVLVIMVVFETTYAVYIKNIRSSFK